MSPYFFKVGKEHETPFGNEWYALPIIVVIMVAICALDAQKPGDLAERINKAPLVSPTEANLQLNSGRFVKTELYSGFRGNLTQTGSVYAYELFEHLDHALNRNGESYDYWTKLRATNDEFALCDSNHDLIVHTNIADIDPQYLRLIFEALGKDCKDADIPAGWYIPTTANDRYRAYGLIAKQKLLVVGTFWRTGKGNCFTKNSVQGIWQHSIRIASDT